MLAVVLFSVLAADDSIACEDVYESAMSEAPASTPEHGELCSDPGDPRCRLQRGDTLPTSRLPGIDHAAAILSAPRPTVFPRSAPAAFLVAAAIDSGVGRSLYRPPR
jgi:hypothetical protein